MDPKRLLNVTYAFHVCFIAVLFFCLFARIWVCCVWNWLNIFMYILVILLKGRRGVSIIIHYLSHLKCVVRSSATCSYLQLFFSTFHNFSSSVSLFMLHIRISTLAGVVQLLQYIYYFVRFYFYQMCVAVCHWTPPASSCCSSRLCNKSNYY